MKTCPKCLGAKEIMVPKQKRGFEYEVCDICEGTALVSTVFEEDYINTQKPFYEETTIIY